MTLVAMLIVLVQLLLALVTPSGFLYFSLLTNAIPIVSTGGQQIATPIGNLDIAAIRLLGLCAGSLIVLALRSDDALRYCAKSKWHWLFVLYFAVSLAYSPDISFGLRMLAKVAGPVLVFALASVVVETEQQALTVRNAIIASGTLITAFALVTRGLGIDSDPNASLTGVSGLGPPGMGPPVYAAHMLPVVAMVVSAYLVSRARWALALSALFAICVVATLQRISIAAAFLGIAVAMFFGARRVVSKAFFPAAMLLGLPMLLIFNDTLRKRMFYGATSADTILSNPTASLESINSSGRFALWDKVLDRFYHDHHWFGSGVGATQQYLYETAGHGIGVVHSEYIRMLSEGGIVACVLFAVTIGTYVARLLWTRRTHHSEVVMQFSLAGLAGLASFIVYIITDNGFDYVNQCSFYLFVIVALGSKQFNDQAILAEPRQPRIRIYAPKNLMT